MLFPSYLFLLFITQVLCRTFYVSSSIGLDSRTILEAQSPTTPWRTISKTNSLSSSLLPGDSILFCEGETFYGQLQISSSGNSTHPIVLSSYSCNISQSGLPEISGAISLDTASWISYGQGLYSNISSLLSSQNVTGSASHVTVGNKFYLSARFPNAGLGKGSYLFISPQPTANKTTVLCPNLTQSDGYWVGANLRIRTSDWTYETRTVIANSNMTLNFSSLGYSAILNWGFYLDNIFGEWDAPGEWYFNTSTKNLYVIPEDTQTRNGILTGNPAYRVRATVLDNGIVVTNGNRFIEIRNLKVFNFKNNGIQLAGNNQNVTISNVQVNFIGQDGIRVNGGDQNTKITNSRVENSLGRGIAMDSPRYGFVSNNTVLNVGMIPGYGFSGVNGAIGILFSGGSYSTISFNYIQYTGYIGIRFDGQYHLVDSNIVLDVMETMADGSSIYCWGATIANSTVSNNLMMRAVGNRESTGYPPNAFVNGIYLDDNSWGHRLVNNTIYDISNGIFVHNSHDNIIENNLIVMSESSSLRIGNDRISTVGQSRNNTVIRNRYFQNIGSSQIFPVVTSSSYSNFDYYNNSNYNYYCNPFNSFTHFQDDSSNANDAYRTLNEWQSFSGFDLNSRTCAFHNNWTWQFITITNATNLIYSDFRSSKGGWFCNTVPNNFYCNVAVVNITIDTDCTSSLGCLRMLSSNTSTQTKILGIGPLRAGKTYKAEFTLFSNISQTIPVGVQKDSPPYSGYGGITAAVQAGVRATYKLIFSMPIDDRLLFQFNIPGIQSGANKILVSDLTLVEVNVSISPSESLMSPFFNDNWETITIDTSAGYVDSDGQIVTSNIQLESRKGIVLFKADCRYTLSCAQNPCNITTGRCICSSGWTGLDCSTPVTTGRITSGSLTTDATQSTSGSTSTEELTTSEFAESSSSLLGLCTALFVVLLI